MNRPALLVRLFGRPGHPGEPVGAPPAGRGWSRGRAARVALAWFAVMFLALQAAAFLAMNEVWPALRDPEYGRRVARLKERLAENPGRPLVVVIGSSRAAMGVRPDVWEATRPGNAHDPLLFNMSLVGSGPLLELFCLRRLYADGVRPAAVVFEYWPPFLREDGPYWELGRVDPRRLLPTDEPFIREFADNPDEVARRMRLSRWNPLYENRDRWLGQVAPSWLPWERRADVAWVGLDAWGWLPGVDDPTPPNPAIRSHRLAHCETIYRTQFVGYTIDPRADRGLREAVALARSHGAQVAFAYLPEASEFRGWIPPAVEAASREHLARLRHELNVPLIDARLWLTDGLLVDGFHMSRTGAAEFTRRFGPAVAATFPDLGTDR